MKKKSWLLLFIVLVLSGCKSHQKKILIYANSNIQVDESQKNISVTEGNTQVEKELDFTSSDPVVLNISGPQGHFTLEAKEDGFWLANLKKDTIVGSLQHTGSTANTRITQEELNHRLDSLNQLVKGTNITAQAKNYFITPAKIEKISDNTNVKIFGPFTSIPHDFDAGTVSEIYKFYNISEVNTIIQKLTEMSKYKYEKGDEKK
ncbi:MAG TPA: hypothetical protein VNW49_09230 [Puia sp.]|jgi:hypothetical protein|nr:hypothetical protein [Puia sp.]